MKNSVKFDRCGGSGPALAEPIFGPNTPYVKKYCFFKLKIFSLTFSSLLPKSFSKNASNCISENLNFKIF